MPHGKETTHTPTAAAARPLAATAHPANVTQDAARSCVSTGAPTLLKDDMIASLPGADALAEPDDPDDDDSDDEDDYDED
jgi:hypothetical protein